MEKPRAPVPLENAQPRDEKPWQAAQEKNGTYYIFCSFLLDDEQISFIWQHLQCFSLFIYPLSQIIWFLLLRTILTYLLWLILIEKNRFVALKYFLQLPCSNLFSLQQLFVFKGTQSFFARRHLISCCYNTLERLLLVQVFISCSSPSLLISEVCRPCVSSSGLPLEAIRLQASLRSPHPGRIYWPSNDFAWVPALQTGWQVDTRGSLFGI